MKRLALAITACTILSSAAVADPVADRQALMKANGAAAGAIAPMLKGEKPFDAAVALQALQKLADDGARLDPAVLWPAGSEQGGDSRSSPKVWEDPAGFQAEIDKFRQVTAAAVAAAPQDQQALASVFQPIGASCGTCHQGFRLSRN